MAKAIKQTFATNERVNLIVGLGQWSDMTAKAIAADAKLEFRQLDKTGRVPRLAILSNKQCLQALMNVIHPLFPMVDIRMLSPEDVDTALAFATQWPGIAAAPGSRGDAEAWSWRNDF